MIAALIAALVAIFVAALLTPFVRRFARAVGAVDAPGGRRVHVTAIPRLGGIAIVIAYVAALLVCLALGLLRERVWNWTPVWTFLGGGLLIAAAGVFDDVRSLGARRKLFVQCLVATAAWFGGARIASIVFVPGLGQVVIGDLASYLLTVVWILAFINAINIIDGLDGLAGGVVFFATVTNVVVAVVTDNVLAAVLNAALGGAVLGFLFYNFNPATIFMGDTGSMFLGYALGTAALMSSRQKESTLVSLLVPVIALGLPIADTLLAMVRRVLARRSIFSADREHLHHRLLDLGLTHRRAVLILYGTTLLLCVAAIAAALGRNWQVGAAIAGAVLTLLGITRFAGYFELILRQRNRKEHLFSGATSALRRSLPELIVELRSASSQPQIWAALERVIAPGHFAYAEYCPASEQPLWRWEPTPSGLRQEGTIQEAVFEVRAFPGAPAATLCFGCVCEGNELPLQLEVLLQMVSDAVEAALVRTHVRMPASMVRAVASA
jgi:UDP-GlcNAc:undecaprenyl-phosphate/decaprenyl-phosphate GlcNAc-1-phosphate transferase